jgi:hypothetical protein
LKRGVGDQSSNFAFAGRTTAQRVFGYLLGYLEIAALLTPVFIDGHAIPQARRFFPK